MRGSEPLAPNHRDQEFESASLQQRVACEPDFLAATGASVRPLIAADRFLKITMKGHMCRYLLATRD